MGYTAAPLEKLIEQFSQFPGIGRKGATRMAYQVLSMSDADAAALAEAIQNAHTRLHRCRVCPLHPLGAAAGRSCPRGGNACADCRSCRTGRPALCCGTDSVCAAAFHEYTCCTRGTYGRTGSGKGACSRAR